MKWSQLPNRKKGLWIGVGVAAIALMIVAVAASIQGGSVGADNPNGTLELDSVPTQTVTFAVVDQSGAARDAFIDAIVVGSVDGSDGVIGETLDGAATLELSDGLCYDVQALDKETTASGKTTVCVNTSAEGATTVTSTSDPVTIRMQ